MHRVAPACMIAVVVDGLAPGISIPIALLAAKVRAVEAARGARHPWFAVSFVEPRRCAVAGSIGRSLRSIRSRDAGARRVAANVERRGHEAGRLGRRHGRGASDGEPEQENSGAHTSQQERPREMSHVFAKPRQSPPLPRRIVRPSCFLSGAASTEIESGRVRVA